MAKEAKRSHNIDMILKNAAHATKYTASSILSDKIPYTTGTVSNTLEAVRDLREWGRQNNPFKAVNGNKDPLVRQIANTASKMMRDAKKDLMTGDLTFKKLNKTFRDFVGADSGLGNIDIDFDIDFSAFDGVEFTSEEENENTTASAVLQMGESLSNDIFSSQAASTSAMIEAVGYSTNKITHAQAAITDAAVNKMMAANITTTTRISSQIGQVNGSLESINQNLMSIVSHNNEMNKFISQTQNYMEHTEQSLNDIKALLGEVVAPYKKQTEYAIKPKADFLENGFDIKKYVTYLFNDSSASFMLSSVVATTMKALKMTMPSFVDENAALSLEDFKPLKTLTEKLIPAVNRIGNLDKTLSRGVEIFMSKMEAGDYKGLLNLAGMFGFGSSRFSRNRFRSDGYEKGISAWNGKSARALEEVIPSYLSHMEGYLKIIAENTGNIDTDNSRFQEYFQSNLRTFDYKNGNFLTHSDLAKQVQKQITDAANNALGDAFDQIEKLIDNSPETNQEITEIVNKILADKDYESRKKYWAEFNNVIARHKVDSRVTTARASEAFHTLIYSRADVENGLSDIKRKMSQRDIAGYQLGENVINKINPHIVYDSSKNRELAKYNDMTPEEKAEYDRKNAVQEEQKGWFSKQREKWLGKKDKWNGRYSDGQFSDIANYVVDFKDRGTMLSRAIDYANDMLQGAIISMVHQLPIKEVTGLTRHAQGTNSLPKPGLFIGNTGERVESIPVKQRVDNFVNLAEAFGEEAKDIRFQLSNMGKDRGVGNFRFADGADEINNKDFSLSENADGTFNLVGKRGGTLGTLGEDGMVYTSYGRKARANFDRKHGSGSFDEFLNSRVKAKREERTGNKFLDNYISQMEQSKKNQTVKEELIQNVNDIAHNTNVLAGQTIRDANNQDAEDRKNTQSEFAKRIFGDKDENGFYKGKFLSDFANMGVDFKNMINHAINGKGYTTSAGVKIKDSGDSIQANIGSLGDKAMQAVFGKDYKDKKGFAETSGFFRHIKEGLTGAYNGNEPLEEDLIHEINIEALRTREEVKSRHDAGKTTGDIASELGIDEQEVKDIINGTLDSILGGNTQKDINDSLNAAQGETNKKAQELHGKFLHGVKGGLIGLGAGMVGAGVHGLIPSLLLPGGPIGGAILGVAGAMLSKNDKFMNWMFGDKDDDGKRMGGIISRDLQEKFKSFGSKAFGPGVIGAIGGLIFPKATSAVLSPIGGAILGGGPIGGALLGIGASMIFRSEAMQKLWYGEDGNSGLKGALGSAKQKAGDFLKKNAKGIALTGMGAVGGALLGSGLFGATVVPGLLGATIGLASSSKSFSEFLFGTKREKKDENGNVIGFERDGDGFLGKVGRMISLNLLTPFKRFAKTSSKSIAEWFRHDILWNMKSMLAPFTEPLKEAGKGLAEAFADLSEAASKLVKKIFNPLFKVGKGVLDITGKIVRGSVRGGFKLAGNVIAAPFKILGGMGRAMAGKQDSMRDHMTRFRFGNGVADTDFKYENAKGLARIFNPMGRLAAWGANKIRHGVAGTAQFVTGAGDSAFAKASLVHSIPEAFRAGKRAKGGAFSKINAFGQAINPFNIFDRNRQIYAENNGLAGNAAFMNPIEKRRHKRAIHEINFDDKTSKRIERTAKKWAKQDGYNNKIELTNHEFNKRKRFFARQGIDVKDINNSQDLLNLMYDPLGKKAKDKFNKDTKEEKAKDATIKATDILSDISKGLDKVLDLMFSDKNKLTDAKKEHIRDLLKNDPRRTAEDIERDFGIRGEWVQKVMDEDKAAEDKKDEKRKKREERNAKYGGKEGYRRHLFNKIRGIDDNADMAMANGARGLDDWMDNNALGNTVSNILSAPVMAMSKIRDKMGGINKYTRRDIINDLSAGMSPADIAAKYGVEEKQVKRILSEEEVRNVREANGAKFFTGKAKTNANKKDGDEEEEKPFVNATLVGEDGKPLMGKKSFLGKIFGAKGVLTTIGAVAIGGGIIYLLTKFPEIMDFAKNTIWPLLRDVVWPTVKTLLTGIGAAILGTGKFIKAGQNGVQSFLNFCKTGVWETNEEAEKKGRQASDYGLSSNAVELEYLKTRGGFAEATGTDVRGPISFEDVVTAAYIYMANRLLLEGDTSDGNVSYQALADYINEHKWGTGVAIDKILDAQGGYTGSLIHGFGTARPSKKQKEAALQRAVSYVNGEYGQFRLDIDYPTVLDSAQLTPDDTNENVGNGIGYGHFTQTDPRWANRKYSRTNIGKYTTMANGGCGPTALANVAAQSGVYTNPSAIASMAQRFGYTADGGSNAGLFTSGATRLGLRSKAIGAGSIRKALNAGNKVIFAGKGRGNGLYTNAGHILSARGIDKNGNAIVDDPMRRKAISVPISRIGNGLTHAWSIGRGEDETEEAKTTTSDVITANGSDTLEYNGKKYDINYIKENMFSLMDSDTEGKGPVFIESHPSYYYYQKNPKWANVVSPRFGDTIGNAGCVESTFGSLLANITGMNYRPDLFTTKFATSNNLRVMLQNALPPSMTGITVKRYNLRPWADEDYLSNGNFSSSEALDIASRAVQAYQPSYSKDVDPIRGPLLDYIRFKPFIIHGGTKYRSPELKNPKKADDVFYKDYTSNEPIYSQHALLVVPSTSNHNGLDMGKTKYYILNAGTQQSSLQGKAYKFSTLFNHNQGIDSIFTLDGLTDAISDMPGFHSKGGFVRSPEDIDWFLENQDKAAIMETASTAVIKPNSSDSSDDAEEEKGDTSFLGRLGKAITNFGKIIWGNLKALFSDDHKYVSIYDENKVYDGSQLNFTNSGRSNYNYNTALSNAIGSKVSSDGTIDYYGNGKRVHIDSLSPQQISAWYYAQDRRNEALAKAGGIQDNGDGTITVSAEVVENAYMAKGKETYGVLGSSLIEGLKNSFMKSSTYSDAVDVTDYTLLPQWAKDFVHVSKNDFISDVLPTSSKLSQSDILNMVNIATRIISHHEAKGDYTGAYNDMGQLSVGINGFHAGNAAEIFARMKNADTEGDILSDEDRSIASNYEAFSTKQLSDPLWSKYPTISNWLGQHHSANKKIQDAMIQQLQFSAIAKVLPLFDEGILNDPRSILMISQFAGFGPAHTSKIVDSLRANPNQISGNPYGELAAVTKTMDRFYSGRVSTYNKYITGFRNRFRDIYGGLGGEGGSDAIGFGGGIRDSYTTTYPTVVDTPVAINGGGPMEVDAPIVTDRLEIIIHYLKEIAMAAKRSRPVNTATTAQTNLDIGHGGLDTDEKLKRAGVQRNEVLPVYTEPPKNPDMLKSIHNRIARSPRPV